MLKLGVFFRIADLPLAIVPPIVRFNFGLKEAVQPDIHPMIAIFGEAFRRAKEPLKIAVSFRVVTQRRSRDRNCRCGRGTTLSRYSSI